MKRITLYLFLWSISVVGQLPEEFVYIDDNVPEIKVELRYFTSNNFIGKPIEGYQENRLIGTIELAEALKVVQKELKKQGLGLLVYDAYRPQRAVDHFVQWASDLNDVKMKAKFYPDVEKKDLFKEGYIASKSSHTRGSTVDVTLIDLKTGMALDMGSPYDFFGKVSWVSNNNLSTEQITNRNLLQTVMLSNGFKNYAQEWWHFTLENEPFPDTYFDFVIE
ncbi:M15 family metallopeptidase [Urechidicola sp. KH5]